MIRFSPRGIRHAALGVGIACIASMGDLSAADDRLRLAPYRALYDLANTKLSKRAGIKAMTGLMAIGFEGSICDGYTSTARIALKIRQSKGKQIVSDLKSTSWEEGAGLKFRFNSRQTLNGRLSELVSGRVSLKRLNAPGKGVLLKPKKIIFQTPKNTLFPIEYTRRVIRQAMAGKTFYQALVFDGTERSKTIRSVTLIGKLKPPGTLKPPFKLKAEKHLAKLKSWTIVVSYYSLNDKRSEQTPNYRATLLLYENGVVTDMVMQYSDFTLKGTLRSLEVKALPAC